MRLNKRIVVRMREAEFIQAKKILKEDKDLQNFSHFVRAAIMQFIRYKVTQKKLTLDNYFPADLEHGQPGFNRSQIEIPWAIKTDTTKLRRIKHGYKTR